MRLNINRILLRWCASGAVLLASCLLSVCLWRVVEARETAAISALVAQEMAAVQREVKSSLRPELLALVRMKQRWDGSVPDREQWELDARGYLSDISGLESLAWNDASHATRWTISAYRPDRNTAATELQLPQMDPAASRPVHISKIYRDQSGDQKFQAYIPLARTDEFAGALTGTFDVEAFFDSTLNQVIEAGYAVHLVEDGTEIYGRLASEDRFAQRFAVDSRIRLYGADWGLRLWPTEERGIQLQSSLPRIVLFGGLLASAVSSILVFFAQTSWQQADELKRANQALATAHDNLDQRVSERTRELAEANEALAERESRIELLLNSTAEAIYGLDLRGNATFVNEACARMLGYSDRNELYGRNFHQLIHHTHPDGTPYPEQECHIYRAFRQGCGTHISDEVLWRADGSSFPAEYWSFPVEREGKLVGSVVTFIDITERLATLQRLQAMSDAKATSEERLKLAVLGSTDGLWDWDIPSGEVWYSPRLCSLLGFEPHEFLPRLDSWESRLHAEDKEATLASLRRHLEQNDPYDVEFRMQTKSNAYRWFRARGAAVRDESGQPIRMAGSLLDIHDFRQATRHLEQANAELLRSNQELDSFAYIASHDLRSPLRAIDNLASWIEEDAQELLPEDSKGDLQQLRQRVRRMDGFLDDLLRYSRIGRKESQPVDIDTDQLVRDVLNRIDVPEGFQVRVATHMPTVFASSTPLEQVFQNLITNAIKHHDQNTGCVEISGVEHARHVEFVVHDDGPGIPNEFHERVFGMFQTLKPRDEVEGSGIGLALVKKNVEIHGGSVALDVAEGRGTTFRIHWPKRSATTDSNQSTSHEKQLSEYSAR